MVRPLRVRAYSERPLNVVFGAPSHVAILRSLRDSTSGFTGREIARRSGVTRVAAMNALTLLESAGLVRRRFAGRAHVFRLNREHWLVDKGILPLLEAEAGFRERLRTRLAKAVARDAIGAAVFGSAARGEETPESDLDLCVIVKTTGDKERVRRMLNGVSENLGKDLGVRLSPLLFTAAEFRQGYRRGETFFSNVVREGKRICGIDLREVVRDAANESKAR